MALSSLLGAAGRHRFHRRLCLPGYKKKIQTGNDQAIADPLFIMGGLQGAIGWVMVKSGLTGDAIYVQPTKLALHFIFAMALIACTMWFALQLLIPAGEIQRNTSLRTLTAAIILLLFFQLLFGALMAGHKAASVASTWPTINGDWIPQNLFRDSPALLNFINNKITIHFVHRGLAYLWSLSWFWYGR